MKGNTMKRILMTCACLSILATNVYSSTTNLPCGIGIQYQFSNTFAVGSNLSFNIALTNASATSLVCVTALQLFPQTYEGGNSGSEIRHVWTNVLLPGGTAAREATLSPADYASDSVPSSYSCSMNVNVENTTDDWVVRSKVYPTFPQAQIDLSPSSIIVVSNMLSVSAIYRNPFPFDLSNVVIRINGEKGLSADSLPAQMVFTLGTLTNNEIVVVTTNVIPSQVGQFALWTVVNSSKLNEAESVTNIVVTAE
jgi:hypothetical protein